MSHSFALADSDAHHLKQGRSHNALLQSTIDAPSGSDANARRHLGEGDVIGAPPSSADVPMALVAGRTKTHHESRSPNSAGRSSVARALQILPRRHPIPLRYRRLVL